MSVIICWARLTRSKQHILIATTFARSFDVAHATRSTPCSLHENEHFMTDAWPHIPDGGYL